MSEPLAPTEPNEPNEPNEPVPEISHKLSETATDMQKCEWKMKTAIIRTVVAAGGTVFGGAVRDYWLHDHHASQFYASVKNSAQNIIDAKEAPPDATVSPAVVDALYNDAEYCNEYRGRTVMPEDIDATIHESFLPTLLEKLRALQLTVRQISDCEPCDYIPGITLKPGEMRHRRFRVSAFSRNAALRIRQAIYDQIHAGFHAVFKTAIHDFTDQLYSCLPKFPAVTLDLMVCKVSRKLPQPRPPFANLDFECNGLILTTQGIGISRYLRDRLDLADNPIHLQKELQRILEDIGGFRARLAQPFVADYRMRKMLRKGYTITGFREMVHVQDASTPDAGHCLICHDDLSTGPHYKLHCCEARYHTKCLFDACTIGPTSMILMRKCPMCRANMMALQEDATILGMILKNCGTTPATSATSSDSTSASTSASASATSPLPLPLPQYINDATPLINLIVGNLVDEVD